METTHQKVTENKATDNGSQAPPRPRPQTTEKRPQATAKRLLADILEDLKKPIPKRLLESKKIQGTKITYCPWYRVQKILDHYTGGLWEYEVRERRFTGKDILLTVRIYIHAAEGRFFREGTGIEGLDVDSFGDPQSNAESMAFRRAAAKWGLGLDLYEGE